MKMSICAVDTPTRNPTMVSKANQQCYHLRRLAWFVHLHYEHTQVISGYKKYSLSGFQIQDSVFFNLYEI
jgi:hypothetical protein